MDTGPYCTDVNNSESQEATTGEAETIRKLKEELKSKDEEMKKLREEGEAREEKIRKLCEAITKACVDFDKSLTSAIQPFLGEAGVHVQISRGPDPKSEEDDKKNNQKKQEEEEEEEVGEQAGRKKDLRVSNVVESKDGAEYIYDPHPSTVQSKLPQQSTYLPKIEE